MFVLYHMIELRELQDNGAIRVSEVGTLRLICSPLGRQVFISLLVYLEGSILSLKRQPHYYIHSENSIDLETMSTFSE